MVQSIRQLLRKSNKAQKSTTNTTLKRDDLKKENRKQSTWRIEKETEPQLKTNNVHLS